MEINTLNTKSLHYLQAGEGQPLVLLHGLSGSTRWWRRNIPALSRRFTVYAVDLLGFGRSRGHPFILSEASDMLLRWLDDLRLPRIHIAGHSMGGHIAAALAARSPDRIDHLALVDAAAVPLHTSMLRAVPNLLGAARYMPLSFLPVLVADALTAGPKTLYRAADQILHADISAELHSIQARTLIVWGENDRLIPLQFGQRLHQLLPAARFVVIPRAGHNPMWDQPMRFNDLLLRFLCEDEA